MTLPRSESQMKPIPDSDYYGIDELALFRHWTRSSFLAETGQQAPPWDPSMRIKRWYDSAAAERDPEEPYFYRSWALVDGRPAHRHFAITCREAATLNLPGSVTYSKRVTPPTPAYMTAPDGSVATPVIAGNLSSAEEAQALARAVSRDTGEEWQAVLQEDPYPFVIVWTSFESRRIWNLISPRGEVYNAGRLLEERSRQGADSPGKWESLHGDRLVWIPHVNRDTGEQDLRPPYAVPMRSLMPDEQIVVGFGGLLQVKRTPVPSGAIILPNNVELREWLRPVIEADRQYWLAVLGTFPK